jgi:hypothetical protein
MRSLLGRLATLGEVTLLALLAPIVVLALGTPIVLVVRVLWEVARAL